MDYPGREDHDVDLGEGVSLTWWSPPRSDDIVGFVLYHPTVGRVGQTCAGLFVWAHGHGYPVAVELAAGGPDAPGELEVTGQLSCVLCAHSGRITSGKWVAD